VGTESSEPLTTLQRNLAEQATQLQDALAQRIGSMEAELSSVARQVDELRQNAEGQATATREAVEDLLAVSERSASQLEATVRAASEQREIDPVVSQALGDVAAQIEALRRRIAVRSKVDIGRLDSKTVDELAEAVAKRLSGAGNRGTDIAPPVPLD
jgi:TolA-binding protein